MPNASRPVSSAGCGSGQDAYLAVDSAFQVEEDDPVRHSVSDPEEVASVFDRSHPNQCPEDAITGKEEEN